MIELVLNRLESIDFILMSVLLIMRKSTPFYYDMACGNCIVMSILSRPGSIRHTFLYVQDIEKKFSL